MKRCAVFFCVLICLTGSITFALASNFYIIPDSNTRYLTKAELWDWQYDALGYILNEIFARHGYPFISGGKYDNYFSKQVWYSNSVIYDTPQECYKHLSNLEWKNEQLIKEVRAEMKAANTTNPIGKKLPAVSDLEPPVPNAFPSFERMILKPNQKLAVYSGPGTHYYRGANGKAMVNTNEQVYIGGVEDGWIMIMYWTNYNSVRVGFTQASKMKDKINPVRLSFYYASADVTRQCSLTSDPCVSYERIMTLYPGTQVILLAEYVNEEHEHWAFIETRMNNVPVRGFTEAQAISSAYLTDDDASLGFWYK